MLEFKTKKKKVYKKILQSKLTLLIVFLFFLFMVNSVYGIYTKNSLAGVNVEKSRIELQNLESRRDDLALELEGMDNERGIEEEIRKNFSVAKPNEGVIIVVSDKEESSLNLPEASKSWWQKILFIFDF